MCGLQTLIKALFSSDSGAIINSEIVEGGCLTLMSGSLAERPSALCRRSHRCGLPSLAPLALIFTAGGLPLNLPCALLVCAVADCALINLHFPACRYDRRVRVAVRPCGARRRKCEAKCGRMICVMGLNVFQMFFDTVSYRLAPPDFMMEVKPPAVKITQGLKGHCYCGSDAVLLYKLAQRRKKWRGEKNNFFCCSESFPFYFSTTELTRTQFSV